MKTAELGTAPERDSRNEAFCPDSGLGDLELSDLIDASSVQSLLEDFYKFSRIPMGIIDLNGKVLVEVGWQSICLDFHRKNLKTSIHCRESDTHLSAGIPAGEIKVYKCRNNLWDAATPIIIGGRHMGNIFAGQFFFDDEEVDVDLFRAQAKRYGFDEEEYLAALAAVPRVSREAVRSGMEFCMKFSKLLSQSSYNNLHLSRSLEERDSLIGELQSAQERLRESRRMLAAELDAAHHLSRLGTRMIEADDIEALYEKILDTAVAVMHADYASLQSFHPEDGGRLRLLGSRGFNHQATEFWQWVSPDSQSTCGMALHSGRRVHVADVRTCPVMAGSEDQKTYLQTGIRAVQTTPLLSRSGTLLGMLSTHWREAHEPTANQLRALDLVARQAADLIDRRQAEDALRARESFYRQTLESIPGMVFTTRPDGFCDYQSRQWESYTGIPVSDHIGDGWNDLLHPEDRPRAYAAWRKAVDGGAPYDLEYRVRRHDGEYEWFKVIGRPIHDEEGRIARWFGVAANIHELKQTEEKLTAAKAVAEEASRAKSEFLANMSHEIRTPMTVFLAAVENLLRMDEDPERLKLLAMADRSARRLRSLIDDILDFSRIEARRMDLEEEPLDLRATIGDALEMFSLHARGKGLRLTAAVAPEAPRTVIGDPGKLGQVLINLIGNAVKFTHKGEIRVSAQPRGAGVEFSVADTGIGIPEEKRHLLFKSFSQVDSSFSRDYGGTGLGLAISKGLVELMGGDICVRSRDGGGSVFSFTLPLKLSHPHRPPAAADSDQDGNPAEKPAVRILLAEDDSLIREMLCSMLERRGWQVSTAETGVKALESWTEGDFDLILMDLQMPEMNGLEVTREIRLREGDGNSRTSIVGLTAHARGEILKECLGSGMDRVLTKPVSMKDLFSAIEGSLSP